MGNYLLKKFTKKIFKLNQTENPDEIIIAQIIEA